MSILVTAFMAGSVLLCIAAAIGGAIWAGAHAMKVRSAAATLAQHLGWKPISAGHSAGDTWYGGVGQGRRVAIKSVSLRNPSAISASRYSVYLRVVMEIVVREPLGAMAFRSIRDTSSLHRFEEAFSTENAQRIGPEARKAMIAFVALGYPTGLQGATYRATPGTRNLWLKDRSAMEAANLDPAVMPDARTVLVHDHPHPQIAPDAFGKLLFDMATVAYHLERGE